MNYIKIYKSLCDRGQIRVKEAGIIYERHHIVPRSFGGKNNKDNLTNLTLREHYMAHLLLVAIYPKSPKMKKALFCMCFLGESKKMKYERYKPSNRTYESIRGDYIRSSSGINSPYYGIPLLEETKKKISEARKGKPAPWNSRPMSNETKKKISEIRKSMKGSIKFSEEVCKRCSERQREEVKNGRRMPSFKGFTHKKEVGEKLRNLFGKGVVQLSLDGQFIKEYLSSIAAEEETDIFATAIRKCCRGGVKTAGKFNWMHSIDYYSSLEESNVITSPR